MFEQFADTAKQHFFNALNNQAPRIDCVMHDSPYYCPRVYKLQTSQTWYFLLVILAHIFMYLVLFSHHKPGPSQAWIQCTIVSFFWLDILMEVYHKHYEELRLGCKFQLSFYLKIALLCIYSVDQISAMTVKNDHFFRFGLIFRAFLPIIYDKALKKNVQSMLSLYKDILVFTFFYAMVIIIFAMFATKQMSNLNGED